MPEKPPPPTRWSSATSPVIAATMATGQRMAVLPIGATEQHGPHLPTGTDTALVEAVCAAACAAADVLMLPPLPYGCSHGHTARWAGTLSLSPRVLAQVIEELATWAIRSGVDRLLIVSGHATNGPSIESAILQLRHDHPHVRFAARGLWELSAAARKIYTEDGADVHANLAETAMLLALCPEEVDMAEARDTDDLTIGRIWRYDMPAVTETGVVGHPKGATAERGRGMRDQLIRDLTALLACAAAEDWPDPAPGATFEGHPRPGETT